MPTRTIGEGRQGEEMRVDDVEPRAFTNTLRAMMAKWAIGFRCVNGWTHFGVASIRGHRLLGKRSRCEAAPEARKTNRAYAVR